MDPSNAAPGPAPSILIVEDEILLAKEMAGELATMGYRVSATVTTGQEAVHEAGQRRPDIIFMDIMLRGEMDGIEAARIIHDKYRIPVIFVSAYCDRATIDRIKTAGPFGYIMKPFDRRELEVAAEMALYKGRTEGRLLELGSLLENILAAIPHPFIIVEPGTHRILMNNPAVGLPDTKAPKPPKAPRYCYEVLHGSSEQCERSEGVCPVAEAARTARPLRVEHPYTRLGPEGETVICQHEVHAYPILSEGRVRSVILYAVDITERKSLERQYYASQKMESIGRLASGVAHDFSNLLAAVLGFSEMAMMELPAEHPAYEKLELITEAAERATALTAQLLAFSSRQVLEVKPVEPGGIVEGLARILTRILGDGFRLDIKSADRLPFVLADRGQFEQVVMNLAINARDAMPGGGTITISTGLCEVSQEEAQRREVEPGPYLVTTVSDTGEGISPEVRERIFEPFFTTKKPGKGTGLGLATVYGITRQHGGFVTVESEKGLGASFCVHIPALAPGRHGAGAGAGVGAKPEATGTTDQKEMALPRGEETILLVSNEPLQRTLVGGMLVPLGYRIIEAQGAEGALELEGEILESVDLVLADSLGSGGADREFAERLRGGAPGLLVLVMSDSPEGGSADKSALLSYIQRPIKPPALAHKIRELLEERRSGGGRGVV